MNARLQYDLTTANQITAMCIQSLVLQYIVEHPGCTAVDVYTNCDVPDIPMYVALHMLIEEGVITGTDPYADDAPMSMGAWVYNAVPTEHRPPCPNCGTATVRHDSHGIWSAYCPKCDWHDQY